MKVFISWSGTTSHQVAKVLRDWLPSVIQIVEPYVSSEDIDKGTRWSTDIAGELHASTYGIICLTKENVLAPWINFEAGALGKSVDKSRVSPFLFGLKRSELSGPILQFQSTIIEKTDVLKLLKSINTACEKEGLTETRLEKTFEVWWPKLETDLGSITDKVPTTPKPVKDESASSAVLEELLELTRNNHRILRDPMAMLPPAYLESVFERNLHGSVGRISPAAVRDLEKSREIAWRYLKRVEAESEETSEALLSAIEAFESMEGPLAHILGRSRLSSSTTKRFLLKDAL